MQKFAYHTGMISTHHRREILERFSTQENISFVELTELYVESKSMNVTTLYRIIESFKEQGLIHELSVEGNRIFVLCHHCNRVHSGIKLSYCTGCTHITDEHFALSPETLESSSVEKVKVCGYCSV